MIVKIPACFFLIHILDFNCTNSNNSTAILCSYLCRGNHNMTDVDIFDCELSVQPSSNYKRHSCDDINYFEMSTRVTH